MSTVSGADTPALPAARDHQARRLACLQTAAIFAAGKCIGGDASAIKTADVLKVAEAFEHWVLEGGEQPS